MTCNRRLIMPFIIIFIILLASIRTLYAQDSAQYLRNVIKDLRQIKEKTNGKRIIGTTLASLLSTTPSPLTQNRRVQQGSVPELGLTKEELASLYQAAIAKGQTVRLNTGDNAYVDAAIHEIEETPNSDESPNQIKSDNEDTGYYYYYYPIKNFLNDIISQPSNDKEPTPTYHTKWAIPPDNTHGETVHVRSTKPQYQIHKHTHQHNVKIAPIKPMHMEHDKKHKLEPLFMAISGFIGMAVMFVLSIFMLPKWIIKKPVKKKEMNNNMDDMARIALQAIEGKDCTERFACELGKTARSLNLHENRFIRFMRHIAPVYLTRQFMNGSPKNGNKQLIKCAAIPCKKKPTIKPVPKKNIRHKPPKRSQN